MIPSVFVNLEALPLTPNGKVDRQALPDPDQERLADADFDEPSTPMQMLLAEVWRDALNVDRISVHDNFFDLGGHSLLSMKIAARLQRRIGVRLNPGVFVTQTLGQAASMYEAMERSRKTDAVKSPGLAGQMLQAARRFVRPRSNGSR
jgi:hypothetical protein